jgi:hypothetical protein
MKSNTCEMPFDENDITQYNPLHNIVNIVPEKKVREYSERLSYNKFAFVDADGITRTCFKKFITLIDYVKFLIGKYNPEEMNSLPSIESANNANQVQEYINSQHNYAYVDGFFYYLTSKLLKGGFVHGLDFYDNYVCLTKNCELNIADDFDYLTDSNFFNEQINKLFRFKDETFGDMFKKNEPISLSTENIEIEPDSLDDLDAPIYKPLVRFDEPEVMQEDYFVSSIVNECASDHSTVDLSDTESIDSNEEWVTEDENEQHNEQHNEEENEQENEKHNEEENEKLILIVNKIPTQVIAIECCEYTFDSILDKNEIRIEELESAMFQIIAMLYLYQKAFNFTHNDLHTNNIMCVTTKDEFLHYKIQGKYYKIPTYGRIYKIIDFGRAIYTVNGKVLCSDSFSVNGTAYTQYNFEPFYNPTKPLIEPNYSFDLCRLACSMVDFIVQDMREIDTYRKVPVYDLIISWLYDDNGINVLYKKNGQERYPGFKLYKMIARIVHNHLPESQFSHACFKQYETSTLEKCMDLDAIKSQVHL